MPGRQPIDLDEARKLEFMVSGREPGLRVESDRLRLLLSPMGDELQFISAAVDANDAGPLAKKAASPADVRAG